MRSKSNLVKPEPPVVKHSCTPEEVEARRQMAAKARQELYDRAYGAASQGDAPPKFADWTCVGLGDIGRLYVELEEALRPGTMFVVRLMVEPIKSNATRADA